MARAALREAAHRDRVPVRPERKGAADAAAIRGPAGRHSRTRSPDSARGAVAAAGDPEATLASEGSASLESRLVGQRRRRVALEGGAVARRVDDLGELDVLGELLQVE